MTSARRGAGTALVIPQRVIHRYEHETTEQGAFLNLHAPSCDFANYLFGETPADEADNIFDPPEEEGRPASEAIVLPFAEQGETVTDRPERTIRILADLPELCLTWTRYVAGEEGPGPHIHKEHVDAFFMLTGELDFGVGPEVERMKAGPGTFVLAPPEVVHTFRNEGPEDATWLNFHAPSKGFANFLRDPDFVWDSFDAPADGGRPRGRGDRGSRSPRIEHTICSAPGRSYALQVVELPMCIARTANPTPRMSWTRAMRATPSAAVANARAAATASPRTSERNPT